MSDKPFTNKSWFIATPVNAHKQKRPKSFLFISDFTGLKIKRIHNNTVVTPTRIILMAKGFANPSLTINLIADKLIAKKTLVPSSAKCALVVGFNKSRF